MGADYVINHKNKLSDELSSIGIKGVNYILHCADMDKTYFS